MAPPRPVTSLSSVLPWLLASLALALTALTHALPAFPPAGLSANDHVYVVPIEVESVSTTPPAITFRFHKTAYALDVYRKSPEATLWGTLRATVPAGTSTWTDTAITLGTAYEYRFHATGVPVAADSTHVRTYVLAGIEVDRTAPRGRVVLVMPASLQAPLAAEIARFKRDLVGDGWTVHDVLTPDGRNDWTDTADGHHVQIRDDIRAIYHAHPSEVKHVILLGRVPQPRSGLRAAWAPDGHGDLGAVATDTYYADVDNTWTDTGTITVGYGNEAGTVRSMWFNNPGDGRFDQSHFRHLTEAFEMGWGRIDFRGSVNGGDEIGALRNYLNKVHNYKHAQNGFVPGRRSLMVDGGGLFKHVQEEFWKNITQLSGLENIDYINSNALPSTAGQPEAQYTYDHGPYLYAFTAGNEPNLNSNNSRAVFWTGAKSNMLYWDFTSWTRARLAEPDSWSLSWTSIPARGRYIYHKMALGGVIGDMMKATINNQDNESGLYGSAVKNHINGAWTVQNPASAPIDYSGFTFMGHMGDPTLRDQMLASPAWVRGRLLSSGAQVAVEWSASPDATHGYDMYSAASEFGPYTQRNGTPLHVNATTGELSWTDTAPPADPVFYMVRARKLEATPSGSYFNASVGRIVEVDRTPAAFAIASTSLPTAYLDSHYTHQLATSGGNPPVTWALTSGALPPGLTLSASGLFSGSPTNAGTFPLTLQATDLLGATQSTSLTLHVDMFSAWSLLPNGDFAAAPHTTPTLNQNFSGNWQHPAAPNTQWDYDAVNRWATTSVDGRTGAQPGIAYVVTDNQTRTGAVSFRYDLKNTDGSGKPNTLHVRIYGIKGTFSWDHWNLGSNPTGDATLLLIEEITGTYDWTTFTTPALPVGSGYDYYALRFYPQDVTTADGDFMAIDNLQWSTAAPPPVFYDVTFAAGANGSLTGNLAQSIVGSGTTTVVTAVPAFGYEFFNWTLSDARVLTANPLVLTGIAADLTATAHFQVFNQPPTSTITAPADGATYLQGAAVPFTGTGSDTEDGPLATATWTSSLEGDFTPTDGTYNALSPGTHTITRTVTDSGGKSASAAVTITVLAPIERISVADAMVRGDASNAATNYGTSTPIRTRTSELAEGLYRFDVSELPGTLVSATLRLVLSNADGGPMNVHALTDDTWSESTVTHASRPAPYGDILGQIQAPVAAAGTALELDVTSYVATRLAPGLASFATTGTGSLVRVHSRESSNADNHPRLILVYSLAAPEPPPPPPPATPVPTGFLNVTAAPFFADPTGATDSTAALQAAINAGRDEGRVVWFPAGTYRVSQRLEIDQPDNQGYTPVVLMGSTVNPAARATLFLAPNSPGFNDPAARRAMIHYFNIGTADAESGNTDLYDQAVIGLDLKIGAGNDGATALRLQGAEGCTIQDVNIDLTEGGHTGIHGIPGSGGSTHRVTITGGVIGIDTLRPNGDTGGSQPTPVVTGSSFINQSGWAVRSGSRGPVVMVGCVFTRDTPGAFFRLHRAWAGQPFDGSLQLIDSSLDYATPHADNTVVVMATNPGRSFHFDNVHVRNAPHIWTPAAPSTTDGWHHFSRLAVEVRPASRNWGQGLEVVWQNGAPGPSLLVEGTTGIAPPADLQTRHRWSADFPTWEHPGVIDVTTLGAVGDGVTDNRAVLQAAIDAHEKLFFPKGVFAVSGPLDLRPDTKLIGSYSVFSVLTALSTLDNRFGGVAPEAPDAPIVRSADTADAETWIAFLQIRRLFPLASHNPTTPGNHALEWRSGGDSVVRHVMLQSRVPADLNLRPDFIARLHYGYNTNQPDAPDYTTINQNHPQQNFLPGHHAWPNATPNVIVRGHGGGRWFGFWFHGRQALRQETPFLRVENTTQPIHFYHLHLQQQDSRHHAEFYRAANVSIYGVKGEVKGAILHFEQTDNVRVFGLSGRLSPDPDYFDQHVVRFLHSTNFLLSGFNDTIHESASTWFGGEYDRWIHANILTWRPLDDTHGLRPTVSVPSIHRPLVYLRGNASVTPVAGLPLTATITGPADGTEFAQGAAITLTGTVHDRLDGNVSATGRWFSDLDGLLGEGASLTLTTLSPGTHTLAFEAANARGDYSIESRTLTIHAYGTQLVYTVTPEADATVRGGAEINNNYGADTTLRARNSENSESLLRFAIPANLLGDFTTATLSLHLIANDTGTVVIHTLPDLTWGEMTVTGATRPTLGAVLGELAFTGDQSTPQTLDVSSTILATLAAEAPAVAFAATSPNLVRLRSRESSDPARHPRLTLTTTIPTPPPPADPFAAWADSYSLSGDAALPATDSLGDGLPNLLRYALGGAATTPASALQPSLQVSGLSPQSSHLTFTFARVADPSLTYAVWASNDLINWGPEPIWSSTATQNTEGEITVTDSLPTIENPRRFLRLSVSQ